MASWQEVKVTGRIEGVRAQIRLAERPKQETDLIRQCAFEYANGDVAAAELLLRKVTFFMYFATWGDSLFVADSDSQLASCIQVMTVIEKLAKLSQRQWVTGLVNQTARGLMEYPYYLPFYGPMLLDLGGREAYELFLEEVARPQGIPMEKAMRREGPREAYEMIKGKSYWEMPRKAFVPALMTCYGYWQSMMETVCPELVDLPDGDHNADAPGYLIEVLSEARSRLRQMAKVALGRNLAKGDPFEEPRVGSLSVRQLYELLD